MIKLNKLFHELLPKVYLNQKNIYLNQINNAKKINLKNDFLNSNKTFFCVHCRNWTKFIFFKVSHTLNVPQSVHNNLKLRSKTILKL